MDLPQHVYITFPWYLLTSFRYTYIIILFRSKTYFLFAWQLFLHLPHQSPVTSRRCNETIENYYLLLQCLAKLSSFWDYVVFLCSLILSNIGFYNDICALKMKLDNYRIAFEHKYEILHLIASKQLYGIEYHQWLHHCCQ